MILHFTSGYLLRCPGVVSLRHGSGRNGGGGDGDGDGANGRGDGESVTHAFL